MQSALNALYSINPIAFSVGPVSVHWYGLAYLTGFFAAGYLFYFFAKRREIKLSADDVLTVLLYVIAGVLIGGRLIYVLFYGDEYYLQNPAKILAYTDGGMSFHGGLIGAIAGLYLAARSLKINFFDLSDLAAIGTPIGLFFGRIANFINGELWGRVSDSPLAFVFGGAAGAEPRYPSQLIEALLEGLVLFAVLFILALLKPKVKRGTLSGWFLILYGSFRIISEFFREPDVQVGFLFTDWLTMGMLLSLPMIIGGIYILSRKRRQHEKL